MLAGLVAGLFILQVIASVAIAGSPGPSVGQAASVSPAAAPLQGSLEPDRAPAAPTAAEVTVSDLASALEVVRQTIGNNPNGNLPFTWEELEASAGAFQPQAITPLADTDDNDFRRARWMNGSTQFLGESVDGASTGGPNPGRSDIDWFRFPLSFSPAAAGTITFDIGKSTADEVSVVVYTYPDADPDQATQVAYYDFMNKSQGPTVLTHVNLTAYEDTTYLMLILSPFRIACCNVTYAITNITFSSVFPPDDNNNRTRAEVYNPGAKPTGRQVEQNGDLFDVFDLTNQFTPQFDMMKDDYAWVTLTASITSGRSGLSDYNDSTGVAVADTVSVGWLWLIHGDRLGRWHVFTSGGVPGDALSISGLINGTPVYAAVSAGTSFINASGGPASSVAGMVQYDMTGFSVYEDLAPRLTGLLPGSSMLEDNVASGTNLYDLSTYFIDDRHNAQMHYTVNYNQQPAKAQATVSGKFLSVATAEADWYGNLTLQVAAHDLGYDGFISLDDHATASNYFNVQFVAVNDPPVITTVGGLANTGGVILFTLTQGGSANIAVVATDPDGTAGQSFSMSPSLPFGVLDTANGTLQVNPANADVGVYNFTVTVWDSAGATANASARITVTNLNDEPTFVRVGGYNRTEIPGPFVATQDQPFTVRLEVFDADYVVGLRDNLQYAADKTYITLARDANDFRIVDASFTPTNAQVGLLSVKFSVTDGAAGQFDDNITLAITVLNVNDAPAFVSVATTTQIINVGPTKQVAFHNLNSTIQTDAAKQGQSFTMTVRAADIDVQGNLGDLLTFTTDRPGKFSVLVNPDGVSADITFTPDQADATQGTVTVIITVADSGAPAREDSITVTIDVVNINDAPVLTAVAMLELREDQEFVYTFVATDPDGDPISYGSDSIFFPVDSSTGTVEFTPTNDLIEGEDLEFDVTITARDNRAQVASMKVHVTIANVNDAPSAPQILNPQDGTEYPAGEIVTFTADASDVDKGDKALLRYTWFADEVELGEGRSITHALENAGASTKQVTLRLQVTDPSGASTNKTITVHVGGVPPKSPGFEAGAVLLGLAGVAAVAAIGTRLRRR